MRAQIVEPEGVDGGIRDARVEVGRFDQLHLRPRHEPGRRDVGPLLAAGARYELYWWLSADNDVRDASAGAVVDSRHLRSAEEWLRKSVATDPSLPEARLRLARVLTLRGSIADALAQLAAIRTDDPNYRYLLELFLGQAHERAGDRDDAAAAYARAIALVEWPQAARVAAFR